jgi:aryl-alcohol dehydrogenase-like predicted oxidoreductase
VPLVGARTRQRLAEALGADDVRLTDEQLAAIESAVPKGSAAGDRYDAHQMALLDSER